MNRKNFTKMFVLAAVVSFGLAAIMPAQSATVPKSWNFGTDSGRDGTGDFNIEDDISGDFFDALDEQSLPFSSSEGGEASALTEFSDLGDGQNKDFTAQLRYNTTSFNRAGERIGIAALADGNTLSDAGDSIQAYFQLNTSSDSNFRLGIVGQDNADWEGPPVNNDIRDGNLDQIELTLEGSYTSSGIDLDFTVETFGDSDDLNNSQSLDTVSIPFGDDAFRDGRNFGFNWDSASTNTTRSGDIFSFAVIPEPSTLVLLGLAGLLLMKRRRL